MAFKVLVTDGLAPAGKEAFAPHPEFEVDINKGVSPEELLEKIKDADALIIRSASTATAAVIEAGEKLKVIGRAGIGVDNIDIKAATAKGVIVMNTPEGNVVTTAEQTISLMMSAARKIPEATQTMREGKWEKKKFVGVEVYNKTLGLIGLGNIGSIVANRAQGLKMKTIAFDPFIAQSRAEKMGVELVELEDLFKRSDFITVHTPLTDKTRGIVNKESIAKMKDGVILINCARGGVMDETDVAAALESGKVAAAAFDVYAKEPPDADNPLLKAPNVVLTPHLGASTGEAQENVSRDISEQIVDYLKNGAARNCINFPSVQAEMVPLVQPYVELGERLGLFMGQWCDMPVNEVDITFSGTVTEYDTKPIEIAMLKGVMTPMVKDHVNYVNAPYLAEQRDIKVNTTNSQAADFTSQLTLTLKGRDGEHSISGVLFGANNPRIVRLDEYHFDARPQGCLIVMENDDKPGVIGGVGAAIGEAGLNIARMGFGREAQGMKALSVVEVDGAPDKALLEKLKGLPHINSVTMVQLDNGK